MDFSWANKIAESTISERMKDSSLMFGREMNSIFTEEVINANETNR